MIMAKKERTPVDDIKDFQESLKESKPVLTVSPTKANHVISDREI